MLLTGISEFRGARMLFCWKSSASARRMLRKKLTSFLLAIAMINLAFNRQSVDASTTSPHSKPFAFTDTCMWESAVEGSIRCLLKDRETFANLTKVPSESLTSLSLVCKPEYYSDSDDWVTVDVSMLYNFSQLRALRIIGCRIAKLQNDTLSGLGDLRNLTISIAHRHDPVYRYHQISAAAEFSLEIDSGGFQGVSLLENIDLSSSNLLQLPLFYPLGNLVSLNLSKNAIESVADDAFLGLKSLKSLDMSDNRIAELPAGTFRDAANSLKELKFRNNSIGTLPSGLLRDMTQLVSLDLSQNALKTTSLTPETFAGLIRLVLLNLSKNHLTFLDPRLFKDLYTLQILNLAYNEIELILPGTFAPLSNLHTLDLSRNRLQSVGGQSLSGLFALSVLTMEYNQLDNLHPDTFKNCSSLQDLNLSNNNFDKVPSALRDMGILKTLDLGENKIKSIDKESFAGMTGLYGLRLMYNAIKSVPRESLAELPALQILSLANNEIQRVDGHVFRGNPMLQAIRLDSNLLVDISSSFVNVSSLIWLNVSDNKIERFEYGYLPPQIQWLNINMNDIADLGGAPSQSKLKTLDVSFNKIRRITASSIPESIEILFLNDNQIDAVEPKTFVGKENLTRVHLYANQIERMELSALQISQVLPNRELPAFYIGGNPFVCDCTTEWLQQINNLTLRQHPRIMDLELIYCTLPYPRRSAFVPLKSTRASQFLCAYTSHCFALCHCCEFDACDCEMTCPSNCTCYHDQSWSANVVDCSNAGYNQLPGRLPMDATEVYLDGNDLGELNSHSFIGRVKLDVLYANNSNVVSIRNLTFSGIKRLSVLHLEDNRIGALQGMELRPLESLRELYLQNNNISHIHNDTFVTLRYLEILRLDNNRLSDFNLWQLSYNPYLVTVSLSENPWLCECSYVERARQWMYLNTQKISDWRKITCSSGMPLLIPVNGSIVSCAALSGITSNNLSDRSLQLDLPIVLVVALLLAAVVTVVLTLRNRRALRSWATSRCYKTAAFEDREKPFDAYISYSAIDESFVSRVLVPGLENSYRLCLHYRDLGAGGNVVQSVAEAADSSRRTILVLSRNFLHGEWSRFEFKIALREALKGRNVLVVLVGGVCPRDLDSELRKKISSHTVLVWGDKLFWQKLRYAMPPLATLERPPSLPTPPPPPQHLWA